MNHIITLPFPPHFSRLDASARILASLVHRLYSEAGGDTSSPEQIARTLLLGQSPTGSLTSPGGDKLLTAMIDLAHQVERRKGGAA